jgi:hypothetical protein
MEYFVLMLHHKHEITPSNIDYKFIGLFDSEKSLENARVYISQKPGFSENSNGFIVTKLLLNKTHWGNGFDKVIDFEDALKDDAIDFCKSISISELGIDSVVLLSHFYEIDEDNEDARYIGVYTIDVDIENIIRELSNKKGFANYRDSFNYNELKLNNTEWSEGFVTVGSG